jgi:hypothetical protein
VRLGVGLVEECGCSLISIFGQGGGMRREKRGGVRREKERERKEKKNE